MKKFIIFVVISFIVGIGLGFLSKVPNSNVNNGPIFDAQAYVKISTEKLFENLGNPKYSESLTNTTTEGGEIQLKIYSYNLNNSYVEFIAHDGTIVKIKYFSNSKILFGDELENIFKLFNIETTNDNMTRTTDSKTDIKFSNVSSNVQDFEIHGIDVQNKTFDGVFIIYDNNY